MNSEVAVSYKRNKTANVLILPVGGDGDTYRVAAVKATLGEVCVKHT